MIEIAHEARVPRGALPRRELAGFVHEACAAIGLSGEVSVLLTTDAAMQELNRNFRRKNKPTDVLSFPALAIGMPGQPVLAGDLALSLDIAARQAAELGHSLATEVRILLLHGLLHLAGFDHEQDTGQMARRERALRRLFDLPVGLIQRTMSSAGSSTNSRAPGGRAAASNAAKGKVTTRDATARAAAKVKPRAAAKAARRPTVIEKAAPPRFAASSASASPAATKAATRKTAARRTASQPAATQPAARRTTRKAAAQ